MDSDDKPVEHRPTPHGPLRSFLKLLVEIDSSRFVLSRLRAALALVALLALFAALGYGVPALLARHF